jgi:hypothetical protein
MASNSEQYTIPLAIDPSAFITGLDKMDQGLADITAQAKGATAAINESFVASGKTTQDLAVKMEAGAVAAKKVSDAAKAAGADINKAFSADNIKTNGLDQKVTEFVAKLKNAAGQPVDFKFNVNQSAVKVLVDQLTKAKGEAEAFNLVLANAKDRLTGLQAGSVAFVELNAQIEAAETFMKALGTTVEDVKDELVTPPQGKGVGGVGDEAEKATAKFIPLRLQLKQMKVELQEMEQAGKFGSAEFVELSKRAGEVSDQIQDTNQRIKNLASDTKGLDAGITAIRGLAGAFAIGQGALAAFGAQNEEAAAAIQKVQGAMSILQGIQEVANVLNKDSALMVYLKTFALKADTAAIVEHTEVVVGDTAATESAIVATEHWTAALLLNPLTAIVAVLAVATFALYKFVDAQKAAGLSADEFNKYLEAQKALLEEDLAISSRRISIEEANATSARKNQSFLQEIRVNALKEQKATYQAEFNALSESRMKLDAEDKNYAQTKATLDKELGDLEKKRKDLFSQIRAEEINLLRQQNEEKIKLQDDLLKQRQAQAAAEVEIAKQAKDYVNQIQDAKISELRDGEDKELKVLDQALKVKIQQMDAEQKAKLTQLTDQRAQLELERQLADENGKKVIDGQVANLNKQIELARRNGEAMKNLERELTIATETQKNEVIKKYAEQRRDIEFSVANTLLGIQKESLTQKLAIIELAAQHEIDIIERTNQDRATKDLQEDAIEQKRLKDRAAVQLEFRLKELDLEKTNNENKLLAQKSFFDKSRDGQALANLLELQIQLEHDQKVLAEYEKAGSNVSDQVKADAKQAVLKGQQAVKEAASTAKPQDIFELLFPGDDNAQKLGKAVMAGLEEVGKAVDAYTNMLVANYQKQIDAQKKVVKEDDDALSKLQDQLKAEQELKKKGYANNVDGIQKEIAEKNKQRDEDVKKQEDYQKKMEAIQRKALAVQTAIQAANLISASANIFLAASKLAVDSEGVLTVPAFVTAGVTVGAMIAAFIAAKSQAFEAVGVGATTTMAEGGIVKGRSHAQGGQKYYAQDNSGGITELEAGEHVTKKRQTEKYLPLLQVINDDKLKEMDDRSLIRLLSGLGVHFQEAQHREVLTEAKEYHAHQVNQINVIPSSHTPKELSSIDRNLQLMLNRSAGMETVTEEGGYIVIRKGNSTKRIKK